jgi:hypothetical protein
MARRLRRHEPFHARKIPPAESRILATPRQAAESHSSV